MDVETIYGSVSVSRGVEFATNLRVDSISNKLMTVCLLEGELVREISGGVNHGSRA